MPIHSFDLTYETAKYRKPSEVSPARCPQCFLFWTYYHGCTRRQKQGTTDEFLCDYHDIALHFERYKHTSIDVCCYYYTQYRTPTRICTSSSSNFDHTIFILPLQSFWPLHLPDTPTLEAHD